VAQDIRDEVAALKQELAAEREERVVGARAERQAFLREVRESVSDILSAAREARDRTRSVFDEQRRAWREQRRNASSGEPSTSPSDEPAAGADTATEATEPPSPADAAAESTPNPSDAPSEESPSDEDDGSLSSLLDEVQTEDTESSVSDAEPQPEDEQETSALDVQDAEETLADEGDEAVDDLTEIQGIGPKMALRFRKAGVHTFDDLAQLSEERVREIMGGLPSFANVEAWIEQAADRADESDT
jgi:predicted flap endonuclease-1-like 5' DNA nuclease